MPRERFKSFEELGRMEQSRRRRAAAQRMGAPLRTDSSSGKLVVHADIAAHADPAAVHQCRTIALDHMQERLESSLPRKASRHRSFSHRSGEDACRAVRVRDGLRDHWAAQLERSPGPGQTIVTEVAVAHSAGRSPTITVEVVDRSVVPAESMREYPAEMLATMAERMPLLQHGRRLSHEPVVVETAETMSSFQQMLLDPGRQMPLAVLSVPPEPESSDQLRRQWKALARTLTGLAIVWVLPPAMTYRLSELVTKNLSVFLGAWRYYRPGFSHQSRWSDHPLFLQNRMVDDQGLADVTAQFLRMAVEDRQRAGHRAPDVPGYERLAAQAAQSARGPGRLFAMLRKSIRRTPGVPVPAEYGTDQPGAVGTGQVLTDGGPGATPPVVAVRESAPAPVEAWAPGDDGGSRAMPALVPAPARKQPVPPDEAPLLRRKLKAATVKARTRGSRFEQARRRAEAAERERDESRKRVEQLAGLVRSLGGNPDAATPFPTGWEEFAAWSDESLAGRLTLASAARRELSGAEFEDIGMAAACLNWLARDYRDGRLGGGDPALHGRISDIEDGVYNLPCGGDSFECSWEGRRHRVEWHIKRGANTRDPRRCLRIYYFWDEEARRVVVASMPAHRRTGVT